MGAALAVQVGNFLLLACGLGSSIPGRIGNANPYPRRHRKTRCIIRTSPLPSLACMDEARVEQNNAIWWEIRLVGLQVVISRGLDKVAVCFVLPVEDLLMAARDDACAGII